VTPLQDAIITFPIFGEGFALDIPRWFTIFGFRIHFYGVILGLGLVMGSIYAMVRAKDYDLTQDNVIDMLLFAVPTAIVFSRLYYVAGSLDIYLRDPLRIITGIRSGGLTIYGVILGAILGAWLCSRVKKIPFLTILDLGACGLLIGQAIGRWGNFVNRELFGIPTDVPWRMGLNWGGETLYVHPTFLYEALWNTLGLILLHLYSKKVGRKYKGQIFVMYIGWYGLGRTWVEALRDPSQNMLIGTVSVNMLVAIGCVIGAIAINMFMMKRTKKAEEV